MDGLFLVLIFLGAGFYILKDAREKGIGFVIAELIGVVILAILLGSC